MNIDINNALPLGPKPIVIDDNKGSDTTNTLTQAQPKAPPATPAPNVSDEAKLLQLADAESNEPVVDLQRVQMAQDKIRSGSLNIMSNDPKIRSQSAENIATHILAIDAKLPEENLSTA